MRHDLNRTTQIRFFITIYVKLLCNKCVYRSLIVSRFSTFRMFGVKWFFQFHPNTIINFHISLRFVLLTHLLVCTMHELINYFVLYEYHSRVAELVEQTYRVQSKTVRLSFVYSVKFLLTNFSPFPSANTKLTISDWIFN